MRKYETMANLGFGKSQGRDWGGRRKVNPKNAPKITRRQVFEYAKIIMVEVKRDGNSTWMYKKQDTWYTCGMTNYLALEYLKNLEPQKTDFNISPA